MRLTPIKAFTLAEVLITLGIIGIVATMTIPDLVANYQSRSFATAASVFESKLAEALRVMNTEQSLAGYRTTEDFVNELSKHIRISNICTNENIPDCYTESVLWGNANATPVEVDMKRIKTSTNFGQKEWNTSVVPVQFANGTNALISYNPECIQDPYSNQIITLSGSISGRNGSANLNTTCLGILYDTNGAKGPNKGGSDVRGINIRKLTRGCFTKVGDLCIDSTPVLATPYNWNACVAGRTSDPKDQAVMAKYGITLCATGDDYWAGAVMQCGGIDKLVSENQILEIAKYLYGTDDIAPTAKTENLRIDPDKVASLGFTSNSFSLISNTEYNMAYSFYRSFSTYITNRNYANRNNRGYYVFCIGEE